jgi:von Willebrand factor type A domain
VRARPTGRNPRATGLALVIIAGIAWISQAQTPIPPATSPDSKAAPKTKSTQTAKSPSRKARPGDDEPIVMSSEALAKARGKTLEKDRYSTDWSEVPPWRQASFFGIKAEGQLFIYVVDCSGSMIDEDRLDRAKSELRRSVGALQSPQRFKVIFYNDRPIPMPGELPKPADQPSKAQLSRWMSYVEPQGATDPRSALSLALAMRPDAVFLLSDGAFPDGTTQAVAKLNPKKVPIHCIDLANGAAGNDLRTIANESGGQYAARGR